ncbi:MAG: ABC transporter substrate-binding protein [Opitutaceae bacterium]
MKPAALLILVLTLGLRGGAAEVVRVWANQGQEAENRALRGIAAAFDAAQARRGLRVEITFFPDFQYTEKIAIAAAARDLPDSFEIDGPLVARYAAAGLLAPIGSAFTPTELADFLPTLRAQGTFRGRLYALGAFDSAMVLYYDRAMLASAGVVPPAHDRGWTWPEFLEACAKLKAKGVRPVSLHLDESADEWFTYAFSPVIWSAGGRLISADGRRVRGVLASSANIRALTAWQALFRLGYASADPADPDPFDEGRTAMDWSGHWMARPHLAAKGMELGVMPLPRLGDHRAAPCGSWCWGVSKRSRDPAGAVAWLHWVTDPRHGIEPMVRANGAVPGRFSAFAAFPEYRHDPYRLFKRLLEFSGHPRPQTPFYATLTEQFAAALRDIAHGADVGTRLRAAAAVVQGVIDRRSPEAPDRVEGSR